ALRRRSHRASSLVTDPVRMGPSARRGAAAPSGIGAGARDAQLAGPRQAQRRRAPPRGEIGRRFARGLVRRARVENMARTSGARNELERLASLGIAERAPAELADLGTELLARP